MQYQLPILMKETGFTMVEIYITAVVTERAAGTVYFLSVEYNKISKVPPLQINYVN
jgi:hypothetical protein